MKLATAINFLTLENDGVMAPYISLLRDIAGTGFKYLDAVLCAADAKDSPIMSPGWMYFAHVIRDEADKLGISFLQCHLPFYNVADPEKRADERREESIRRTIAVAGILGAKWAVAHPGTNTEIPCDIELSKKINIEYFSPLVDLAVKNGLGIALENLFDNLYGVKRVYCGGVNELTDLTDAFKTEHVGVCWDFGHANIMYGGPNKSQAPCLRLVGKRLKMTHVHDNNSTADSHLPPFSGNVDWADCIAALRDIEYENAFSFEVINRGSTPLLRKSEWTHLFKLGEHLLSL